MDEQDKPDQAPESTPALTREQASNALVFLARTELKGAEMPAFASLVETLEKIAQS